MDFPTLSRSQIISFMAKSSLSCRQGILGYSENYNQALRRVKQFFIYFYRQLSDCHTCAINWIILTKMLRGMSLGTTLREPFGNSVDMIEVRRLERNVKTKLSYQCYHNTIRVNIISLLHYHYSSLQCFKLHNNGELFWPILSIFCTFVLQCCFHTWFGSCRPTAADTEIQVPPGPFCGPCSAKRLAMSLHVQWSKIVLAKINNHHNQSIKLWCVTSSLLSSEPIRVIFP